MYRYRSHSSRAHSGLFLLTSFFFLLTSVPVFKYVLGTPSAVFLATGLGVVLFLSRRAPWHVVYDFWSQPTSFNRWLCTTTPFAVTLVIVLFVNLLRGNPEPLSRAHLNALATPAGLLFAELVYLHLPRGMQYWAVRVPFYTIAFHAIFEALCFNLIPGVDATRWYYDPWGPGGNVTYTSPTSQGFFRFQGVVGLHPASTVMTLAILSLGLDGAFKCKMHRWIAVIVGLLSFSGTAILACAFVIGSLVADYLRETKGSIGGSARAVGVLGALGILVVINVIGGKVAAPYLLFLLSTKQSQLMSLVPTFATVDWMYLFGGLNESLIRSLPETVIWNRQFFASTDFGLAFRIAMGGLAGLWLLLLQVCLTATQGRLAIRDNMTYLFFVGVLVMSLSHYSPFNVALSTLLIAFVFDLLSREAVPEAAGTADRTAVSSLPSTPTP